MLIEAVHNNVPIMEIPIKTVYINGNKETHFRPIVDSIAIYSLILSTFVKYILSSLSSFLVDYAAFCIIRFVLISVTAGYRIWISTIVARILSSAYNYVINKKLVFQRSRNQNHSFFKYYILCTAQLCCSAILVWLISQRLSLSEIWVKPFVDIVLFFTSFQIQRRWVF